MVFAPGKSGNPAGRPPGIAIGKARARQLKKAHAEQVAIRSEIVEAVKTKPRDYFQRILDDPTNPIELRMQGCSTLYTTELIG
jgi:hypothetical protein